MGTDRIPVISVRGATKTYGEASSQVVALWSADLDVYPGEVVLLMGPSGSGKTTLLSVMGGILRPTSGSVAIAGEQIENLTERELPAVRLTHIGFVFQGFNLFSTLTAAQNVELVLELKGVGAAASQSRAREVLTQVGLEDRIDSFPANLSGGQKQRVAIARALAGDPDVILADEPTASLDSSAGRGVVAIMRSLAHEFGRAVVIVSHDLRVREFADRIVHMEDGRVVSSERNSKALKGDVLAPSVQVSKNNNGSLKPSPAGEHTMNKRTKFALFGAGAFVAIAFSVLFLLARSPSLTSSTPASFQVSRAPQIVAGPGRVEPASEDIKIGSEISGKLKFVHLQEGDAVTVGQVIAELENDDYRAAVSRAEAQVAVQRASLKKLLVGARPQERQEAKASVQEADAVVRNSQAELERRKRLHAERVVSQEELQIFVRQNAVAQARLEKARARRALIEAPPRQEDRAIAEAELARAQAMLQETRARLAKTQIRSPIDGTVLRKHHRSGESVSNSATVPDPILTVGDQRRLNVRVEVDESDVGRVWVGQEAKITADALAGRSLLGHVIRVGQQLGRKKIHTDEPAERVDNKFLEVLIELEPGAVLPIGLRVAALITVGERSYLETSTSQLEMPLR